LQPGTKKEKKEGIRNKTKERKGSRGNQKGLGSKQKEEEKTGKGAPSNAYTIIPIITIPDLQGTCLFAFSTVKKLYPSTDGTFGVFHGITSPRDLVQH
jgi:hypothetical protein